MRRQAQRARAWVVVKHFFHFFPHHDYLFRLTGNSGNNPVHPPAHSLHRRLLMV